MITIHRINSISDPLFSKLYNLYVASFPSAERRNWAGLEHQVLYEKRFHANALLQNDLFVGFLNYWIFDRFFYIEHLAVNSNLRGQHIGSKVVEILKQKTTLPIVFEVEMPNNSLAIRRIRFYERLGFSVLSHYYAQPPYDGHGFLIPMLLMSNDSRFANSHYESIKETLHTEVYNYQPPFGKNELENEA